MKVGICGDIHIGNFTQFAVPWNGTLTSRARSCCETLRRAIARALELRCDRFAINGDLFHVANPPPQLITQVGQVLVEAIEIFGYSITLGNHDIESYARFDNACSPLGFIPGVHILEKPAVDPRTKILGCPYRSGNPDKWLGEALKMGAEEGANSVMLHMGLSTDRTPGYLAAHQGAIKGQEIERLCKKYGYQRAFFSDWHNPDKWVSKKTGFEAHQLSTLIPASFSDAYPGVGRLCIYDTETLEVSFEKIPGPRFFKAVSFEQLARDYKDDFKYATAVYIQLEAHPEEYPNLRDSLINDLILSDLLDPNTFDSIEVVPKYKISGAKEKARAACVAVKSASTVSQAVNLWLSGRGGDDLKKKAVAAKVAELIQKTGAVVDTL